MYHNNCFDFLNYYKSNHNPNGVLNIISVFLFCQKTLLTKNQFAKDFPHATDVYFLKTNSYSQASFKSDKTKIRAYYDFNNQLIGTIRLVDAKTLPENARQDIAVNYKNYSIVLVFLFELNHKNNSYPNNENQYMTLFGTRFEKADNYFVKLSGDNREVYLKVMPAGTVSFFKSANQ